MKKTLIVFIGILALLLSGCGKTTTASKFNSPAASQTTMTSETTEQPTPIPTVTPTTLLESTPVNTMDTLSEVSMDINYFKPIKECFIRYEFKVEQDGTKDGFIVQGEYDLNMDGNSDTITLFLRNNSGRDKDIQAYIQVNNIKKEFYMDYSLDGEARIIDLDSNDKFLEIAFSDEGPSDDPHYVFYRYDGSDLYKIGSIDNYALINGKGSLLASSQISRFKPVFYSAWFEIENNIFIQKVNSIEKFIGKNYTFDGGEAYFMPTEQIPEKFEAKWEEPRQFDASEIKIINIYFYPGDRTLNYYFVEFPNGEKGMLYFWIGD